MLFDLYNLMIFLDNWFHCPCLGLSDEEAGKLGTYFCEKCKNWASLKQSVLETVRKTE